MTPLFLALCTLVATANPYVAPGLYRAPHRAPDEVLESGLPDSCVRVWMAVRACQSGTPGADVPPSSYPLSYIGQRCAKTPNSVSKALVRLIRDGWVERLGYEDRNPVLRCHCPPISTPVSHRLDACESSKEGGNRDAKRLSVIDSTPLGHRLDACESSTPTPPNKEESCPNPVINPERTTTIEVVREGDGLSESEGVVVLSEENGKAADPAGADSANREAKNSAWYQLRERGVEDETARQLAAEHWAIVPEVLERYDAGWTSGDIGGPGWIVNALRGYVAPKPSPAKQAAKHTGRTPEQEHGSRLAVQLAAEPVPGTPGASAAQEALEVAARSADEAAARRADEAAARRQQRRARRAEVASAAAGLPTTPEPQD